MSLDQADRVKAFKISRFSFVNGRKINHRNKSQLLTACTNTCSMDTQLSEQNELSEVLG